MKKRDVVSIWILFIISLIFIISIFAVPAINNLKESILLNKFDNSSENIIDGAKSKYSANINDVSKDGIMEYTVNDLIKEGYLKEDEINPITGEKYKKDDKVLVITKNGYVTYKFVSGTTLINKIKKSDGVQSINDEIYFIGENPNNYISFNEEIYRIIKVDKDNNIVVINDEFDKKISLNKINTYLETKLNDSFNNLSKEMIVSKMSVLDYDTYKNTFAFDKSFINKNYDYSIWLYTNEGYKAYNIIDDKITDEKDAWINPIAKIDYSIIVEKGKGTRTDPYILSK